MRCWNSASLRRISSSSGSSGGVKSIPHAFARSSPRVSCTLARSMSMPLRAVMLSASASSRPSGLSRLKSVRCTTTSFLPSVGTTMTSSMPMAAAVSVVELPAIMLPSLSTRIERPAPNLRRLSSRSFCPNSVWRLKLSPSGVRSARVFMSLGSFMFAKVVIFFGLGAVSIFRPQFRAYCTVAKTGGSHSTLSFCSGFVLLVILLSGTHAGLVAEASRGTGFFLVVSHSHTGGGFPRFIADSRSRRP